MINYVRVCSMYIWLVVSTPLNNISKLGLFFPIYGKIKNVPNHQPEYLKITIFDGLKSP